MVNAALQTAMSAAARTLAVDIPPMSERRLPASVPRPPLLRQKGSSPSYSAAGAVDRIAGGQSGQGRVTV